MYFYCSPQWASCNCIPNIPTASSRLFQRTRLSLRFRKRLPVWDALEFHADLPYTKVDTASCRMHVSARGWTSAAQKNAGHLLDWCSIRNVRPIPIVQTNDRGRAGPHFGGLTSQSGTEICTHCMYSYPYFVPAFGSYTGASQIISSDISIEYLVYMYTCTCVCVRVCVCGVRVDVCDIYIYIHIYIHIYIYIYI